MASAKDHAKKDQEPSFNAFEEISHSDLIYALNWYNLEPTAKKREWVLSWTKKNRPELVESVQKAKDTSFTTFASLVRLRDRGANLGDHNSARIEEWFGSLGDATTSQLEPAQKKTFVIRKSDPNFLSFESSLDDALLQNSTNFSIDPNKSLDAVKAYCSRELANIQAEPDCYPKHMKKWFNEVLDRASKVVHQTKSRVKAAPSNRKQSPEKIVKDVRFAKKDDDTGLTGYEPIKIIGARKAFVYDVQYRSLIRLIGTEAGLSFDGINFTNLDLAKSSYVTLRKPKEVLKQGQGVRELDRLFSGLKAGAFTSKRTMERYLFLERS